MEQRGRKRARGKTASNRPMASDNVLKYGPRNIPAFIESLLSEKYQ
jgi:hypothetical protein